MKFELEVVVTTKHDQLFIHDFHKNMSVHGNWFRAWLHELGPGSRAALVCQDDFQPGITWGEPAWLMADAINHETWASLILVWRRAYESGWPGKRDYMEESQPS